MKIVFAASEAAPYIKTGGLGDVAQALPAALAENPSNELYVILPYYGKIKQNQDIKTEYMGYFYTDLAWRHQYVGLFRAKSNRKNLRIYLLDNEDYFMRMGGIYGYDDDGERFAFFSKALLDALVYLGITPDIIHCNDWQTALIPTLLHAFYGRAFEGTKTVFTIHNIEYQGKAHPYFLGNVLGLPIQYENALTFQENINFMKGGILSCDALTTVSRTYAKELCYPYFSHGLSSIIEEHRFKLKGIVNGIDVKESDPAVNPHIPQNYSYDDLSGKAVCKKQLQRRLGLVESENVPVIGIVSRLVKHKGLDILCYALEELMQWDIQLVILGTGEAEYEERLKEIASRHKDKFSLNLCFSESVAAQVYAGCDLYLMPSQSEPCGLSQLIAMRYGTIPIVHAIGGLKDTVPPFDPTTGEGLGFTFERFDSADMLDAIGRALTICGGNRELWQQIIKNAMTADLSWSNPAKKYESIYQELTRSSHHV